MCSPQSRRALCAKVISQALLKVLFPVMREKAEKDTRLVPSRLCSTKQLSTFTSVRYPEHLGSSKGHQSQPVVEEKHANTCIRGFHARGQGSALWRCHKTVAPACFLLTLQQEVCSKPESLQRFGGSKGCKKKCVSWFQAIVCICIARCCLHMGKFRISTPFAHFNKVCEFTEWTLSADVAGKDCLLN